MIQIIYSNRYCFGFGFICRVGTAHFVWVALWKAFLSIDISMAAIGTLQKQIFSNIAFNGDSTNKTKSILSRHPAICYHHKSAHSHRPFITHPAFINHILTTLRSISLYRMIDQQILIWWIPRNRPFLFKHVFDLQNMYLYLPAVRGISIHPQSTTHILYIFVFFFVR